MGNVNERRYGEAIAELTKRLAAAGVEEPHPIAHDYVRDLVQQGWRPSAPPVEEPPRRLHAVHDPDHVDRVLEQARERIHEAQQLMKGPGS